ncbi:hypothetical protein [Vreelandella nigrificans]|uniref:DUF2946 domain-containing protein n=1 Tax=Vreelandella nigrificans TaxID=2042704 RepID=A0A2A4HMF5_9GAMM|nr:hypothetical protein [Halomonas nigrificans]PCF96092.1 hypothetical protein CPA45_08210 [Halomonas nigrificans]
MTNMQRFLSDRNKSGIVAILVSYVLMLHVLLGSYAQAAVLGDGSTSPLFVLCDPHGLQNTSSEATSASELNNLLCQSACTLGAALAGMPQGAVYLPGESLSPQSAEPATQTHRLFALFYPRAPPLVITSS